MRYVWPWVAVSVLVCASQASAQDRPTAVEAQILKELADLRKEVQDLRKEVDALKERLAKFESKPGPAAPAPSVGFPPRGADSKALAGIVLPENPTREQLVEYVRQIVAASAGQTSVSSVDPQIDMLAKVGPDHLDVLLDGLADLRKTPMRGGRVILMADIYFIYAIERIADERHKDMIIKALDRSHELARVILAKGWEKDAASILISELRGRPMYLPIEWINAVASLEDAATYPALEDYFIVGTNHAMTYEAIRSLPGLDLTDAVEQVWKNSRLDRWEKNRMAAIAVGYGHADALACLFDALGTVSERDFYRPSLREAILSHVDARGSNDELKAWFQKNKDKLVFDPKDKMFRVKE